ncbi:hypothetical protein ACFPIK_05445 [Algoriphagus aquatilis]|uniref:Uncharacterized protein n=1 Tax=Algoriphagus aquatilis TaxID=490186 RepID=A0ABW0BUG3_9BACT
MRKGLLIIFMLLSWTSWAQEDPSLTKKDTSYWLKEIGGGLNFN